jgi:flagellar basal body-associated protein FliL
MADGEETPKETPKSKSRIVIWACVFLAFVAIFGVFVKFMFFPEKPEPITGTSSEIEVQEPGPVVEIGDFLTNLAKPNEDSFISIKVAAELDAAPGSKQSADIAAELASRDIELKQIIEEILRARNRESLTGESGLEGVRSEILRNITARLQKGKIRKIMTYNMIIS